MYTARQDSFPLQDTNPHEITVRDDCGVQHNFDYAEDKEFWDSLHPVNSVSGCRKSWSSLLQKLNDGYSTRVIKKIEKTVKRFLDPDTEGFISVQNFIRITRWFGSFKKYGGSSHCIDQIRSLVERSGVRNGRNFISWFAGVMTIEEAEERLNAQPTVGTYLVRFSEGLEDQGGFVLAMKTSDGVQQYRIQGDPKNASASNRYDAKLKLTFETEDQRGENEDTYPNLVSFINGRAQARRIDGVSCSHICPNLPLNATFQGYK